MGPFAELGLSIKQGEKIFLPEKPASFSTSFKLNKIVIIGGHRYCRKKKLHRSCY
jgi:hypothetical protein